MLTAVTMNGLFLTVPVAYAAVVCLLFCQPALRDLKQLGRFIPIVIIASTLLWQEEFQSPSTTATVHSSIYSALLPGFLIGVEMSARAVAMVLAISVFMRTTNFSDLSRLLEKLSRSQAFSFVFGLAFNLTPYLERLARDTLNAIKLRGGFQARNLASSVKCLLSSTTLNALAKCDDISYAAEARAFGATRRKGRFGSGWSASLSRYDLILAALTSAVVLLSFSFRAMGF
jgi:energy-coupling factor transporter transmembrane protein EcfT